MSDFEERPRFYQTKWKTEKVELPEGQSIDKSVHAKQNRKNNSIMLFELLRLLPNYSDRNSFMKKRQLIKEKRKGQKRYSFKFKI